jgi:hypothetical protein
MGVIYDENGCGPGMGEDPAPASQMTGVELPADVIESLLAIGTVEWGVSFSQSDEKHASDLLDTLRITREHFGVTDEETGIHGVYLEGTGTVLAPTGMSPNSPQHARILVGAWNQLVEIAKARAALTTEGQPQDEEDPFFYDIPTPPETANNG